MPRKDAIAGQTLFCVMCQKPIGADRPRSSVTCSKECATARKNFHRSREDKKECRYCHKPSSPAERARYQRWRRYEAKNPPPDSDLSPEEIEEREYRLANPPQKRGPKPQPQEQENSSDAE